ncbi:hypothetical protein Patl1_35828 [Pistacia atlantica]|nr:hypothetical protein Patl1_35828 [Pistacia atlantica]
MSLTLLRNIGGDTDGHKEVLSIGPSFRRRRRMGTSMLDDCQAIVAEFLWSVGATAKTPLDTQSVVKMGEQEPIPLLQKAIVDLAQVYLRLQSSIEILEHLRKDEEEFERPRAPMELIPKGYDEERLVLFRGLRECIDDLTSKNAKLRKQTEQL